MEDFIEHVHEVQKNVKQSLLKAAEDMKKFYDHHRNETFSIEVGQKVLVNNADLVLNCPSHQLAECYSGPFEITEKVGTHAYCLKLPDYWKNVHPVWNVSKIYPYHKDSTNSNHPWPPPDIIEGEPKWEVE